MPERTQHHYVVEYISDGCYTTPPGNLLVGVLDRLDVALGIDIVYLRVSVIDRHKSFHARLVEKDGNPDEGERSNLNDLRKLVSYIPIGVIQEEICCRMDATAATY
jgi:hypothetical protein